MWREEIIADLFADGKERTPEPPQSASERAGSNALTQRLRELWKWVLGPRDAGDADKSPAKKKAKKSKTKSAETQQEFRTDSPGFAGVVVGEAILCSTELQASLLKEEDVISLASEMEGVGATSLDQLDSETASYAAGKSAAGLVQRFKTWLAEQRAEEKGKTVESVNKIEKVDKDAAKAVEKIDIDIPSQMAKMFPAPCPVEFWPSLALLIALKKAFIEKVFPWPERYYLRPYGNPIPEFKNDLPSLVNTDTMRPNMIGTGEIPENASKEYADEKLAEKAKKVAEGHHMSCHSFLPIAERILKGMAILQYVPSDFVDTWRNHALYAASVRGWAFMAAFLPWWLYKRARESAALKTGSSSSSANADELDDKVIEFLKRTAKPLGSDYDEFKSIENAKSQTADKAKKDPKDPKKRNKQNDWWSKGSNGGWGSGSWDSGDWKSGNGWKSTKAAESKDSKSTSPPA